MNKAALFYVEQTVTVHIVLFYVRAQIFNWLVVHVKLSRPTNERNREQKHITRKLETFITSSLYAWTIIRLIQLHVMELDSSCSRIPNFD